MSKQSIHVALQESSFNMPAEQKPQVSLHVIGQPHGVYTENVEPVKRHV